MQPPGHAEIEKLRLVEFRRMEPLVPKIVDAAEVLGESVGLECPPD